MDWIHILLQRFLSGVYFTQVALFVVYVMGTEKEKEREIQAKLKEKVIMEFSNRLMI